MFNYSLNGITVASILDTRRATKDNVYPVKIRITYKRDRKYYSTGKTLSKEDWANLPSQKSKVSSQLRDDIQNSFDKLKAAIKFIEASGDFSFDVLNHRLGNAVGDSVNNAFLAKIANLKNEGRSGTQISNECALNSLQKFGGQNIQFTDVTIDWLRRYEKYMISEGNSFTTIGMYVRALRSLINDAIKAGLLKPSNYPFGKDKYEIPTGSGRKLALTLTQIKTIVDYSDGNPTTDRYKSLWFFSYLCNGINFIDMIKLKYSNIHNGEISYLRSKTIRTSKIKKEIHAIVSPEMKAIINRWGNPDRRANQYIFPFLNGNETPMEIKDKAKDIIHRTNDKLKTIGETMGIDGLSTYSARHSFASVLKRSGANISFISESLGHADQKTTENYLASFEQDERIKNAALLTKFD